MAVSKRVVIVGGGIAGLSAAFALTERAAMTGTPLHCTVLEAQPMFGGKIVTRRLNGLLVEGGPDSFLTTKPSALALCEKLGLTSQLINTGRGDGQAFIWSRGRLRAFPQGLIAMVPTALGPLFRSGVLSWAGLARMGADWMIPARRDTDTDGGGGDGDDETMAEFFTRRLGAEAFHRLLEPFVAGIYAGDANELSVAATFPQFVEMERAHGGLIKGAMALRRRRAAAAAVAGAGATPARTLFTTLRGGMDDVVTRLTERLTQAGVTLRRGAVVRAIDVPRGGHGGDVGDVGAAGDAGHAPWPRHRLTLEDGETLEAEAVVLATPAFASAALLRSVDRDAAEGLDGIPYASTVTVSMAFADDGGAMSSRLRGYGFVVPRIERRELIAATWSSLKWAGRAPDGQCLIRCYLGGRGREHVPTWDDDALVRYARRELAVMADIHDQPVHVDVHRWPDAMPQYLRGHRDRVRHIRRCVSRHPGLYVTGAAYEGIGLPDCIRDAENTAQAVIDYLRPRAV